MNPSDEVTARSETAPRYPYSDDGVLYPDPDEEILDEDWDDIYEGRYYDSLGG